MRMDSERHLTAWLIELGKKLEQAALNENELHRIMNDYFRMEYFRSLLSEFCWETDLNDWEISDVTKEKQVSD